MVSGTVGADRFRLLMSESGPAPGDFRRELISSTLAGPGEGCAEKDVRYILSGYEGKRVRLALAVSGKDGAAAIAGVRAGQYILDFANPEDICRWILYPQGQKMDFGVSLETAEKATGFTAVLKVDGEEIETFRSFRSFGPGSVKDDEVVYENLLGAITRGGGFTLMLTPGFEGARAAVVTGDIIVPALEYPATVLLEELTGTWCKWCPLGYGVMNYLVDRWPDTDTGARVIGLAYHNSDPMAVDVMEAAMAEISVSLGMKGYPSITVNREVSILPENASIIEYVEKLTSQKSFVKTAIDKVEAGEGKLRVHYSNTFTFDCDAIPFRVVAVVREDEMSGAGPKWYQSNGIVSYGYTAEHIAEVFGEDMVPYMEMFTDGEAKVKDMVYPDVARQACPDVTGRPETYTFSAGEPVKGVMEFDLTEDVSDLNNTSVVLALIDSRTGQILGADRVEHNDYTPYTGGIRQDVNGRDVRIMKGADSVWITTDRDGVVECYSPVGTVLYRGTVAEGHNSVCVARGGFVVVRIVDSGCVTVKKLVL